jgi:hypothetical protein
VHEELDEEGNDPERSSEKSIEKLPQELHFNRKTRVKVENRLWSKFGRAIVLRAPKFDKSLHNLYYLAGINDDFHVLK